MKFYPINTDTFLQILDSVSWRNGSDIEAIADFAGFGLSTVRNAINNASYFGLTTPSKNGGVLTIKITEDYRPKLSKAEQLAVVRKHLQSWEFFQVICEFLYLGETISGAIRKAAALNGLSGVDLASLTPLLNLAVELNLLERDGKSFKLSATIPKSPTPEAGILTAQLDSEMAASLFVSSRLGSDVFHALEKLEQSRLTNAVLHHASNPEKSCEDAGKALESYLRVVGTGAGHDLKAFNGLGEIADFLAGAGRTVIHPKHRDLIKATSTLRNCSAHERDKLTNQPWRKTPEMALSNAIWTLHLMRSVAAWVHRREQVL